jgi:hypothetical protein
MWTNIIFVKPYFKSKFKKIKIANFWVLLGPSDQLAALSYTPPAGGCLGLCPCIFISAFFFVVCVPVSAAGRIGCG